MAQNSIYTTITHETVTGARDRVLDDLNELTNGNADKAIKYVSEFMELDGILEEIKKRKKWEEEAAAQKKAEEEEAAAQKKAEEEEAWKQRVEEAERELYPLLSN